MASTSAGGGGGARAAGGGGGESDGGSLPVGFRFSPTEVELLAHYLARKARGDPDDSRFVIPTRTDIYDNEPWNLTTSTVKDVPSPSHRCHCCSTSFMDADAQAQETVIYCFTRTTPTAIHVGKSSCKNKKVKRRAGCGTWKSTGTRKPIQDQRGTIVGSKLHLSFYADGCSAASNWIMHEFCLPDSSKGEDLILCRIKGPSLAAPPTSACPHPPLPLVVHAAPLADSIPMHTWQELLFCEEEDDTDINPPVRGEDPLLDLLLDRLRDTNATTAPLLLSPQSQQLGGRVCENKEDEEDPLADFGTEVEEDLLQDCDATTATMVQQPPPEEDEEDPLADFGSELEEVLQNYDATTATMVQQPPPEEEDANHCSLPLLSPQLQSQDCNPSAATTVEQDGNHCSLPHPWDMWIGDGDITLGHFLDHACFLEEEEQPQEEQQDIATEPNSSSAHVKESRGGVDSSTSAITPHIHHVSGHLGPEEANASKRRRSLIKCANPNSRCLLPQAKRPRPCYIEW